MHELDTKKLNLISIYPDKILKFLKKDIVHTSKFIVDVSSSHEHPKTFKMIQWILQFFISFWIGDLKICMHGLLHYPSNER